MTLDETFKIESILDKRKTGHDILEFLDTKYFSKSKQEYIRYGDIHLQHFIRIFLNLVEDNNKSIDKEKLNKVRITALDLLGDIHTIEQNSNDE